MWKLVIIPPAVCLKDDMCLAGVRSGELYSADTSLVSEMTGFFALCERKLVVLYTLWKGIAESAAFKNERISNLFLIFVTFCTLKFD